MTWRPAQLLCLLIASPATSLAQGDTTAACSPSQRAPHLDHVIVVVQNLDSARAHLGRLGFRIKAGRAHPNHLLNFHVKFLDGTELEVMSLTGEPLDQNAEDYADLLAAGEGGAYVALRAANLDSVAAAGDRAGLSSRRSASGTWRFLSFAPYSDASGVFFGSGWRAPADPDSIVQHRNRAQSLRQAWVEGGPALEALLLDVGAAPCDSVMLPDGRKGIEWMLASGSLVVVPTHSEPPRPRPVGVLLTTRSRSFRPPAPGMPLPEFWIVFQAVGAGELR